MWTSNKNARIKCDYCGRILAMKGPYYEWWPYGKPEDLDPPEAEHACEGCWNGMGKKFQDLIFLTAHLKPRKVENI